jgi:hypothetical protein
VTFPTMLAKGSAPEHNKKSTIRWTWFFVVLCRITQYTKITLQFPKEPIINDFLIKMILWLKSSILELWIKLELKLLPNICVLLIVAENSNPSGCMNGMDRLRLTIWQRHKCYLCLFTYNGIQHILCCVFALFFFVWYTLCCQFRYIVHFWLPLRYSLTFICNAMWNKIKRTDVWLMKHFFYFLLLSMTEASALSLQW